MHHAHSFSRGLLIGGLALGLALSVQADTGLARHKKLYVVPAPGKVTIDGKLNDWDLSGQVTMYVVSETAEMQSAKFALMYDAEALYISAEVRDPSPMMNRHNPQVDGNRAWDADACQFRLTLDPKMAYPVNIGYGAGDMADRNVVHLLLWNYTDKQDPCLQMSSSMNYQPPRPEWAPFGVVPHDYYQARYLKAADGRGYTFEYRIPWGTLGAKAPLHGGDLVAGTVQFNWSAPDGLTTGGGAAWCYDVMAGPGFPYQSAACWGKLIFSEKGRLPREMVEEGVLPAKPLPLKFAYDLPEDSQITIQLQDQSNVVRRILVPQGDRRAGQNIELWDGLDDDGKALPVGTYTWRGIYHKPITQKFLFSPHNSGQPPYATDDGTGGWGGDHGNPRDVGAFDGGVIMCWNAAEAGWGIIRTDLTGKKQWGTRDCAEFVACDGKRVYAASEYGFNAAEGVKVLDAADSRPIVFGNGKAALAPPPGGTEKNNVVSGIACDNGLVYVSYRSRNLVAVFDGASGALKTTWTVPTPGRLAGRPGGGLAVLSGGAVVAVRDGTVTPLISTHLDAPQGIAAGPEGALYVTNAGQLQNVSVFDGSGKYLRSIGLSGGRPAKGHYNPNGVLEPGGIALDKKSHLWVAEQLDSPKRISEWDAATGAFVNEFFGGCSYFGYSYIDPKHPDEIYCHDVLWSIDWVKNTCQPVTTTWRPTAPDMMWAPAPGGYNAHAVYFTAKNGHQYSYGLNTAMSVLAVRDGELYKPCAAFVGVFRGGPYYGDKTQFPVMADAKKYPNGYYFWQDKNNDQTLQADELQPAPAGLTGFGAFDDDLGSYVAGGVLRPVRVEADGRPVYDLSKVEPTAFATKGAGVSWLDPNDGGAFTYNMYTPGQNYLAKWSADGIRLWAYPNMIEWKGCLERPMQAPGRLYGMTNPLGVAGKFTGLSDYFGGYHVFMTDGVYVGMLMRDGRDGKGLGPDVTASEVCTGQLVKPDGMTDATGSRRDRYFLLAGAADARVTEIFGLDTIKSLPGGTVTLSEADVKLAGEAIAEYNSKLARGRRLSVARGKVGLAQAESIAKALDSARGFSVRAAYDATNLYIAYDVTSPSDLVNATSDPTILFKGGNCLDIQLATDAKADPKRKTPAPGDLRILVTRQNGKAVAVIYRPKIKGFDGKPTVLSSPTGKESFAAIAVSGQIGLDYQKTPAGYTALVTIPQAAVGLALAPGQELRMDVGYLFGNASGNQVAARLYWMNNGANANIMYDIPSESRLEPALWGTATVE